MPSVFFFICVFVLVLVWSWVGLFAVRPCLYVEGGYPPVCKLFDAGENRLGVLVVRVVTKTGRSHPVSHLSPDCLLASAGGVPLGVSRVDGG